MANRTAILDDVRIIICGPRDNTHRVTAERLVLALKRKHGDRLTVVHGGCQTGTDHHVHEACVKHGVRIEVNPADWDKHGNPAGPIRNRSMAKRTADACYGVMKDETEPVRGTANMMREAVKAEIATFTVKTNGGFWRIENFEMGEANG